MADLLHQGRGLAAPIGRAASVALAFVTGHVVVLALLFIYCASHAVGLAMWEGIRPRMVAFGSASAFAFFAWLRRKVGLPPET